MFDVIDTKAKLEKELGKGAGKGQGLGAAACAKAWKINVPRMASSSEEIKEGFIDACLTVWHRAACDASVRRLIVSADSAFVPSPFDSIYKLEAVVKRCGSLSNIRWALAGIVDMIKFHNVCSAEFVMKKYTGRGEPGGKGVLDLLLSKQELGRAITQHAVDNTFSQQLIQTLNQWLGGHDMYREMIKLGSASAQLVATLPPSAQTLARFVEVRQWLWCTHKSSQVKTKRQPAHDMSKGSSQDTI